MKEDEKQKISITTGSWVRGVLVVAGAYVLYMISELILVVIASIVIASAIEPTTIWAKDKKIPRLPSVLFVYIFTAICLSGFFYFLLLPLIGEISSFIKTLTIYSNSVVNGGILSDMFRTQNLFNGLDTPVLIKELRTYLNSLSTFLSKGVISSISLVFGGVSNFILIMVLSFYLAVQEDGVSKFLKMITPLKQESYVVGLWRRTQIKIGLWMQGQLLLGVLVMILVYIGLLLIDIPHALFLAVLAGIFELIPLFGPTLAAIPALFVAYTWGGTSVTLMVAGLYIIIQQFENHLIYPMVVKKMLGVPPMVSILALVVGITLAGFLGVLISIPIAVVILEFLSDIEQEKASHLSSSSTGPVS